MFGKLFKAMGIGRERYTFKPFNIKDDNAFAELNSEVPNLVNVYSKWSAKKVKAFQDHGLEVIRLDMPKSKPVSGTLIREIIVNNTDIFQLPDKLIEAGFMPEAVPGLIEVLKSKKDY